MSSPSASPPLRAVVVDDTPDLRALLVLALEQSGQIVVVAEAGNGYEGVERVREHRPDIVLLDLAMPVMDGLEALPSMRRLCPDATIVVLSGFGATAMADRALAAGADGYLQKGAPASAILDYVRSLVGFAPAGLRLLRQPPRPSLRPGNDWDAKAAELAPYGVVVVEDQPGLRVLSANPRATSLLTAQSPAGRPLAELAPELAALVSRLSGSDDLAPALVGSPPRPVSVTIRRADGVVLVYLHQRDEPGDGEMLRRAIATTAHEIRNPVTVLVGIADTMRDRGDDLTDELRARLRASVVRQARLLDGMTADLLTAAQAHRGTLRVDLERVEVKAVLDIVLEGLYDDVTLDVPEPVVVLADPLRLEQMVTNLLSNARKYGAQPVVVRARQVDARVLVEVSDGGAGVPEAFRPVLFDEFTRAGDGTARGTGLGLYVVRSLAEAQGGTVSHTPDPGGGSIFRITLPAAD